MAMEMNYVEITPVEASKLLYKHNGKNRHISQTTVDMYAKDIKNGRWDENVGSPISIDENGTVRDGQHRLAAIVQAETPVKMWVCTGVSADGIYDNNRKRSVRDQLLINSDLDGWYTSNRFLAVARILINRSYFGKISPREAMEWIDINREKLDGFFGEINTKHVSGITIAPVYVGLYLAYARGVDMAIIRNYLEVLSTGMSVAQEEFPIIAMRNYLLNPQNRRSASASQQIALIRKTQWTLDRYIKGTKVKVVRDPQKLLWDWVK